MVDYQPLYTAGHAVIVGIDSYQDSRFIPLGEAQRDACHVADVLAAAPYDFDIELLLGHQATKQAIQRALFRLRRTQPDDRVLVYFAGHGYTLTNRFGGETGYLAAADTVPDEDFTALELSELTNLRLHAEAKHIAFVFDACFSGRALGLTRTSVSASDKFLLRRAYQVISAGAGDQTVSDYHSMTDLLIAALRGEALEVGPLTVSRVGLYLQQAMAADSGQTQIPQFGHLQGSQGGEFIFDYGRSHFVSEGLGGAISSAHWRVRYGAVEALIEMAQGGQADQREFANVWLGRLSDDQDTRIRSAVEAFLDRGELPPPLTSTSTSIGQPPPLLDTQPLPPAAPPLVVPAPVILPAPAKEVPASHFEQSPAPRPVAEAGASLWWLPVIGWAVGGLVTFLVGVELFEKQGLEAGWLVAMSLGSLIGGAALGAALPGDAAGRRNLALVLGLGWALAALIGNVLGWPLVEHNIDRIIEGVASMLGWPVADFLAPSIGGLMINLLLGLLGGLLMGGVLPLTSSRFPLAWTPLLVAIWMIAEILRTLAVIGLGLPLPPQIGSLLEGALLGLIGGGATVWLAHRGGRR